MTDFVQAVLTWLMRWFPAPTPAQSGASQFDVMIGPVVLKNPKNQKETGMAVSTAPASLALALVDNQKAFLTLSPGTDDQGQPATLKSVPVWAVADPAVASVSAVAADGTTPVTDGMSGWIVAGAPGATVVKITAEGDVVVGKDPLELDVSVAVAGGDPTSLGATVAPAVPK